MSGSNFVRPNRTEFITGQPLRSLFSWTKVTGKESVNLKCNRRKADFVVRRCSVVRLS